MMDDINAIIQGSPVVVFSKPECHYCDKLAADLRAMDIPFHKIDLNEYNLKEPLIQYTGNKLVPQLFIGGKYIGGYEEFAKLCAVNKIEALLQPFNIVPVIDF